MSPDKTALVLRLFYERPLCAACISDTLEVDPEDAIVDLLTRIQDGVYLKHPQGPLPNLRQDDGGLFVEP
jgi:hypothetical protein